MRFYMIQSSLLFFQKTNQPKLLFPNVVTLHSHPTVKLLLLL
ncbi:MAG: hypothetical protein IKK63_05730 [Clostridia bacterium]|nr:hypothetical protein [Clostridia bacterium]